MKKITLITSLLITNISFAQTQQVESRQTKPIEQKALITVPRSVLTPISKPSSTVTTKKKVQAPVKKAVKALPAIKPFSITLSTGLMSHLLSSGATLEYRGMNWGIGAFGYGTKVTNYQETASLSGFMAGIIGHYHFLPAWYTQSRNTFDPGVYATIGMANFSSSVQGPLPMYSLGGFGFDASYLFSKDLGISGYGKMGVNYIFHSETGPMNLGTDMSVGLKFEF